MELVIKPQKTAKIDWKELWDYRELFFFFAWRDVKVRYKQTVIGASWAIFQPFVTMIVFTIFFNKVAGIQAPHDIPYAVFSYTGLLFWNFFASSLSNSSISLLVSQAIITKIYFPRIIAPFSATIPALMDFFFAFLVYAVLLLYYQIIPGAAGILLLLPMLLLALITSSGIGLFFAALNVRFRDVRFVVPFLSNMLLFLTPIIYPVSLVPERFQWVLYLNPMTAVIQTIRAGALHDGNIHWGLLGVSLVVALSIFVSGVTFFKRQERKFADFI